MRYAVYLTSNNKPELIVRTNKFDISMKGVRSEVKVQSVFLSDLPLLFLH